MNREEIKEFLPHREPMLLVDEMQMEGDEVVGKYHVTGEEHFLQGHFPNHPTVPGVILCEIMGQSSALLVKEYMDGKFPLYLGLDKVRFRRQVVPGDTVEVRAHITDRRGQMFFIDAKASVDGTLCCSGSLQFILAEGDTLKSK